VPDYPSVPESPLYDGPIATALGGADLSWILGLPVSMFSYWLLTGILESPAAMHVPMRSERE
jgi:hypothetical protein